MSGRPEYQLTAHFFRAMFDIGILTPAGADAFTHLLLGAVGALIAIGLGLTRVYAAKYAALSGADSSHPYRVAVLGDDLFMVGLPMLFVALVTVLVSHTLFPDERDFRILGPLPVRRTAIVGAKLAALLLFTGMIAATLHLTLLPLMLLTSFNRFGEHAVLLRLIAMVFVSASASLFSVMAITAVVGVLMLVASHSRMHSLTAMTRSLLLGVLVLFLPLVFHLPGFGASLAAGSWWLIFVPPAWFVSLEQVLLGSRDGVFLRMGGIALLAFVTTAMIAALIYIALFRHFERLLLRPPGLTPRHESHRAVALADARLFGDVHGARGTPAFRAIDRFTRATIGRSQLHQGVILGLTACGIAFAMNGFTGTDVVGRLNGDIPPSRALIDAAMWAPFALIFVCGIGIRSALVLPMEHRANWIFRLTEDKTTRGEQMRAVNRIVTTCVVGVPVFVSVPGLWLALGSDSAIAVAVVALVGLVFVHAVLLDWRRIPFTCSYLPGKRLIAHTVVLGFAAFVLFNIAGILLIKVAISSGTRALVIAAVLSVVAWLLWRRRLAGWRETPLTFDDEMPDQPLQLGL
jgi:hypothetical protein